MFSKSVVKMIEKWLIDYSALTMKMKKPDQR